MFKLKQYFILTFVLVLFITCARVSKKVPIISVKFLNPEIKKEVNAFEITNHLNESFKFEELEGKVHLVSFFFATCTTICPAMERELLPIVKSNKEEHIKFLSFTIDPERGDISVLNERAELLGNNKNWIFLNTSKPNLKRIASIYLSAIKNDEDDVFYHTSQVVLLDKKMRIRGLYDILNAEELSILKTDIAILLKE